MPPEALLEGLLSKDAHRIWEAASKVMRLWDREALRWLDGHAAAIRLSTADVPLGGALRPNAVILSLALRRMEAAHVPACFCGFYAEDMFANPQREADDRFIRVLSQRDDPKRWQTDWQVVCNSCGAAHDVVQDDSWHAPTYRWLAKAK